MSRTAALALLCATGALGCTATATQTLGTGTPGRFPRTTELAMDLRPAGPFFGGAELILEAAPEEFGARGAALRGGLTAEPRPGSDEIWSFDGGLAVGLGRPPFRQDEPTTFSVGLFNDLSLRILGHGEQPGRVELGRMTLDLVLGARARAWPWADTASDRFLDGRAVVAGGLGLRLGFDTDGKALLDKALTETANALGL